jgi:hypothetical protein
VVCIATGVCDAGHALIAFFQSTPRFLQPQFMEEITGGDRKQFPEIALELGS